MILPRIATAILARSGSPPAPAWQTCAATGVHDYIAENPSASELSEPGHAPTRSRRQLTPIHQPWRFRWRPSGPRTMPCCASSVSGDGNSHEFSKCSIALGRLVVSRRPARHMRVPQPPSRRPRSGDDAGLTARGCRHHSMGVSAEKTRARGTRAPALAGPLPFTTAGPALDGATWQDEWVRAFCRRYSPCIGLAGQLDFMNQFHQSNACAGLPNLPVEYRVWVQVGRV